MPKIDDEQYRLGREAFDAGDSLRNIVEDLDKATGAEAEFRVMCFALGFFDQALDELRGIKGS